MPSKERTVLAKHKKMCGIKKLVDWTCSCQNGQVADPEYDGDLSDCETHRYNKQCPKCKTIFRL